MGEQKDGPIERLDDPWSKGEFDGAEDCLDSNEKISRAFLEGKPAGGHIRERIVDNMTSYWVTNRANSAARLYRETSQAVNAAIASGRRRPSSSCRWPSPCSRRRSSRRR